jgi:hypothetical protein
MDIANVNRLRGLGVISDANMQAREVTGIDGLTDAQGTHHVA